MQKSKGDTKVLKSKSDDFPEKDNKLPRTGSITKIGISSDEGSRESIEQKPVGKVVSESPKKKKSGFFGSFRRERNRSKQKQTDFDSPKQPASLPSTLRKEVEKRASFMTERPKQVFKGKMIVLFIYLIFFRERYLRHR